jgi:hypothetical protein
MRATFDYIQNPSGRISVSVIYGDYHETVFPSGRSYFTCNTCGENSEIFLYEFNAKLHTVLNHSEPKKVGVPRFDEKVAIYFNAPETAFLDWETIEKRPYEVSL